MVIELILNDKEKLYHRQDVINLAQKLLRTLRDPKKYLVELSVISNNEIKLINKSYRGIDKPTDVLSFPFKDRKRNKELFQIPTNKKNFLGQIFVSSEKVKEQAEQNNLTLKEEANKLFIHGLLHLFGYDHKNDVQENKMKDLEKQILN